MRPTLPAAATGTMLVLLPAAVQAADAAPSPITRLPLLIAFVGIVIALLAMLAHRAAESRRAAMIQVTTHHQMDLVAQYFQAAVATLVAFSGGQSFRGNSSRFVGQVLGSAESLDDMDPVMWRLAVNANHGTTRLICRTAQKRSVVVAEWPGSGGRFIYADGNGRWYEQWPPEEGVALLPSAIRLEAGSTGTGRVIIAPLRPPTAGKETQSDPASRGQAPTPRPITV